MGNTESSVLVTGAFGNLGQLVLRTLKAQGHRVVAMDMDSPANRKTAAHLSCYDDVRWCDIRHADWPAMLRNTHAVVHLAAVLPPVTERVPALAEAINLNATLALIAALEQSAQPLQLVFPSSVTVFGYPVSHVLKSIADTPRPSDNYTRHKVAVEQRLAGSSIPWTVLRIGVSVDARPRGTELSMVRKLFATSPDNPLEYVHPEDVATAVVNAIGNPEALGRVWLIGGGPSCQVTQYDLLSAAMESMGIKLPRDMLGQGEFYTHWMDTAESQRVLRFQQHSFDDYRQELSQRSRLFRPLMTLLSPMARWFMRRLFRAS